MVGMKIYQCSPECSPNCCMPPCCPIPGPVGPTGATGATGATGPTGPAGGSFTARAAAVPDATNSTDVVTNFNELLANLREIGLLST